MAAGTSGFGAGSRRKPDQRFRLKYAPHFGMFRNLAGDDPLEQVAFIAEQGFAGLEDNGLKSKPVHLQEQLGLALTDSRLEMGVFVGLVDFGRVTFASPRSTVRASIMAELRSVVEVAKRVGGMWCSVVPGKLNPRQPLSVQYRNAAETLKQCCDVCDRAGLTMLLEPLCHVNRSGASRFGGNRSGQLLLSSLRQADALARTVDHPRCKVLFDVSHHHALGDDLMADVERYWDSIGYFQLGDNPGRKEPGTGTIDYRTLTTELSRRCYTGLLGMEHGNSLPGSIGEEAVISAYDRLNRYCNA